MAQKYFITTFGCQMNFHDSEILAGLLESMGYSKASSSGEADLILLNTCCVRGNAENRTHGHIGNLKPLKDKNPELLIGVCGCMAQEPTEVQKIKEIHSHVDLVFGTHNLHQLPELIREVRTGRKRVFDVWDTDGEVYEGLPVKREDDFKAWVTIMYGCNNFCSYCIVPHVRGRERSREPGMILDEVKGLVKEGVKEITLLGQNVNSYGKDFLGGGMNFAGLLEAIARNTDIERIRFQTSHPKDLSQGLIEVMAREPKVCRHLHLPVQAGSTRILQLMNRQYTKEQYIDLAERIKNAMPDMALTTDIIVGFPGEDDADFEDTLDLVSRVRYDGAFTFIYSPRVGTPAAKLADPVPESKKMEHFNRLIKLQNQISLEKNQALIGAVTEVLVEGPSEKNKEVWSGRNSQNKLIHFKPDDGTRPGILQKLKITSAQTFTLGGEIF